MSNEGTRGVYGTCACFHFACIGGCKNKYFRLLNDVLQPFV